MLGNPHFPWTGHLRFYRMHMTIPGELNVVGAGILNTPLVGIGHNESMAWTHTVSTARRFGYHELQLAPGDPTAYVYDGEVRTMTRRDVSVDVRQPDGTIVPVTRTLYETHFGPMVRTGALPWTTNRGFAFGLRHATSTASTSTSTWRRLARCGSCMPRLARCQATGFNAIAADAAGEVLYGDLGAIPNVTEQLATACIVSQTGQAFWASRVPVLDGSRSECEWRTDPDSTMPGVFGPSAAPQMFPHRSRVADERLVLVDQPVGTAYRVAPHLWRRGHTTNPAYPVGRLCRSRNGWPAPTVCQETGFDLQKDPAGPVRQPQPCRRTVP